MEDTTPNYFAISDLLHKEGRVTTEEEDDLAFALEWHISILCDGILLTIFNWFDFIDDYRESLRSLGITKDDELISFVLEHSKEKDKVLHVDMKNFPYSALELESERIAILDKKIDELALSNTELEENNIQK